MEPPETYSEWAENIDPDDLAATMTRLEAASAIKAPSFRYYFRMKDRSGATRMVEGSSRFVYDEMGELLRTVGVAVDVTSHFEVRRALGASHDQFQSVLETSPTALIITDVRGIVLTFSRAAEHLFGYAAAEVIGQHFNMLTDQKVKLLLTATRRRPGQMHLLSALRADGKTAPVEVSALSNDAEVVRRYAGHLPILDVASQKLRKLGR